jgi:hypothetical protein
MKIDYWEYMSIELPRHHYQEVSIIFLVGAGVMLISNIIHQIMSYHNENLNGVTRWNEKPNEIGRITYTLLSIGYIILNIVMNFVIVIIGMLIGGWIGVLILGILWLIFMAAYGWWQAEKFNFSKGIFNLNEWILQYSKKLPKFKEYRKEIKTKYNKFLNIEYR